MLFGIGSTGQLFLFHLIITWKRAKGNKLLAETLFSARLDALEIFPLMGISFPPAGIAPAPYFLAVFPFCSLPVMALYCSRSAAWSFKYASMATFKSRFGVAVFPSTVCPVIA